MFCIPDGETQPPPPPELPPELEMPPEPPPILSEVESAIKMLSYGKSPGLDNLPADLIKTSGDFGKKAILLLIKKFGPLAPGQKSGSNKNLSYFQNLETKKFVQIIGQSL